MLPLIIGGVAAIVVSRVLTACSDLEDENERKSRKLERESRRYRRELAQKRGEIAHNKAVNNHKETIKAITAAAKAKETIKENVKKQIASEESFLASLNEQLEQATSVVYHSANGSVAPEWHYDCYVTVTKDSVNVKVYQGYGGEKVVFEEAQPFNEEGYRHFLGELSKQEIGKHKPEGLLPLDGAGISAIMVWTDDECVFSGDEDVDVVVKHGGLIDSFLPLLNESMHHAVDTPYELLRQEEE